MEYSFNFHITIDTSNSLPSKASQKLGLTFQGKEKLIDFSCLKVQKSCHRCVGDIVSIPDRERKSA